MKQLTLAALLLLTACASAPSKTQFDRIHPGMTMHQVEKIIGKPDRRYCSNVGMQRCHWMYRGWPRGKSVSFQAGRVSGLNG